MNAALPRKLASYIHDTGLKALDHLAERTPRPEEGKTPDALQTLVGQWQGMTATEKNDFVDRISASVGEVIAASALLPVGIKVGKKAVKSARKVLKKSAKTLRKKVKAAAKAKKKSKGATKNAKQATSTKSAKSAKKKKR